MFINFRLAPASVVANTNYLLYTIPAWKAFILSRADSYNTQHYIWYSSHASQFLFEYINIWSWLPDTCKWAIWTEWQEIRIRSAWGNQSLAICWELVDN